MNKDRSQSAPDCIGVIVDGNRRWAKARGLASYEGHRAGYEKFKKFLGWAQDSGVRHVITYIFSTENWNRSPDEVQNLMDLLRFVFKEEIKTLKERGIRVEIIGQRERLDEDIQKIIEDVEEDTKEMNNMHLVLALSYGGRAEIVAAAQGLIDAGEKSVTEKSFAEALWTAGTPDPDMIIRTGAVSRLSNFLPWQSVYSELFFTDTMFPDFTEVEFKKMLEDFSARERRHGK